MKFLPLGGKILVGWGKCFIFRKFYPKIRTQDEQS